MDKYYRNPILERIKPKYLFMGLVLERNGIGGGLRMPSFASSSMTSLFLGSHCNPLRYDAMPKSFFPEIGSTEFSALSSQYMETLLLSGTTFTEGDCGGAGKI